MPAFQLTRFKGQINELSRLFTRPNEFRNSLRSLLEYYADWAYRPGLSTQSLSLIPSYHIPPLVFHKLEQELVQLCQENPYAALALADALWQERHLEPRLLAVTLLGQSPLRPPEAIVERLETWCHPSEQDQLLNAIFRTGSARLRHEKPGEWLALIERWLNREETSFQILGLQAIPPLIEDPLFENLPPIFRMLTPLLVSAPAQLYNDLLDIIQVLAKKSPTETAYFLRQQIQLVPGKQATAQLIRRSLTFFPPNLQENLRAALV